MGGMVYKYRFIVGVMTKNFVDYEFFYTFARLYAYIEL